MPYKSGKFSSSRTCKFLGAALAALGCYGNVGFAAPTVQPVKYDGTSYTNVVNSTAYYPLSATALDSGDPSVPTVVDFTQAQGADTSSSGQAALFFNVSDSQTSYSSTTGASLTYAAGTNHLVLLVMSPTANRLVPIAFFTPDINSNGTNYLCGSGNVNCDLQDSESTAYYFGVPFTPGATMRIGIYLKDFCSLTGNGLTPFCNGGNVAAIATIASLQLQFYVAIVPGMTTVQSAGSQFSNTNTVSTGGNIGLSGETYSLTTAFQAAATAAANVSCPSDRGNSAYLNIYQPGDTQIFLDTTQFFLQSVTTSPAGMLVIDAQATGKAGSATGGTFPWGTNNAAFSSYVFSRQPFGNTSQSVPGFQNSSPTTPVYYSLGVFIRDAAGFIAGKPCNFDNVQTADIRGFLNQSSCFIATAAFESKDAAPVVMLRQFRDQILLHSTMGRGFVHWYYGWSPPAANWLLDHPVFRYPVLLALVPVEVVAWLALHPFVFGLTFVAMMALTAFLLFRRKPIGVQA